MSELVLMDASSYIYAGWFGNRKGFKVVRGVSQRNGEWVPKEFEAHGAVFLFREMQRLAGKDRVIMPVFDRTPTIKREMWKDVFGPYVGYKGTREMDPIVRTKCRINKDFAEECCRFMGFPVQAAEGYEADDLIYTLVQMYKDDFEHIEIHAKDGDLMFLVDDNVSIEKVGEGGKVINRQNYEYTVMSGEMTTYNSIALNRLLETDKSDNIEGIGDWWADYINEYVNLDNAYKCGDLEFCRDVLRKAVKAHSDVPNADRVLSTFNIMNPLLVPMEQIDEYEHQINWTMLQYYFLDELRPTSDQWGCENIVDKYIDIWEEELY